jgi:hypothetical protein
MVRNSRGNVMIIALVIVAAAIANFFIFADSFKSALHSKKKMDYISTLRTIEDSVIWSIENDDAWKATLAASAAASPAPMTCLSTPDAVCPTGTNYLNIFLEDGSTILAYGNPAAGHGFTYDGLTSEKYDCTGFNPTVPNDDCPFAFEITWTPVCNGTCPPTMLSATNGVAIDPKVQIDIKIIFSGKSQDVAKINLESLFTKQFIRGSSASALAATCRAARGSFDPVTTKCQLSTKSCLANEVLVGFADNGDPVCRKNPFLDIHCSPSNAPVKVNEGGGLECWKF